MIPLLINSGGQRWPRVRVARTKGNNHMGVFNDTLREYGLGSGEKFKVLEGKNVIRILSEPRVVQSHWKGEPGTQFVAWVLDRAAGKDKAPLHAENHPGSHFRARG